MYVITQYYIADIMLKLVLNLYKDRLKLDFSYIYQNKKRKNFKGQKFPVDSVFV